ncbi:hypothetical protein OUZ56_014633 [Daphnia magna]|uniref:Uncharacterized protein n=1 Tax=Daphnia magna TaxID=35525 RepID=A0ABR0AKC6_9CRUS|nr:hypothetical protein OUZ56_014633 [Daphnia magna]
MATHNIVWGGEHHFGIKRTRDSFFFLTAAEEKRELGIFRCLGVCNACGRGAAVSRRREVMCSAEVIAPCRRGREAAGINHTPGDANTWMRVPCREPVSCITQSRQRRKFINPKEKQVLCALADVIWGSIVGITANGNGVSVANGPETAASLLAAGLDARAAELTFKAIVRRWFELVPRRTSSNEWDDNANCLKQQDSSSLQLLMTAHKKKEKKNRKTFVIDVLVFEKKEEKSRTTWLTVRYVYGNAAFLIFY